MRISEKKASELIKLPRSTIQRFRDIPGKKKILFPEKVEKDSFFEKVTYYYYDEVEMEKLWLIKLFKSLGKSKSEIIKEMSNPNFNKKAFLEKTIDELTALIEVAKGYLNTGIGYETLNVFGLSENTSYAEINELINISNVIDRNAEELMPNKEYDFSIEYEGLVEKMHDIFDNNVKYDSDEAYLLVKDFTNKYFDSKFYSKDILYALVLFVKKGLENVEDMDEETLQLFDYILNSFNNFIEKNKDQDNLIILDINKTFEQFERLAYKKFTTHSVEIQKEVESIAVNLYYMYYKSWDFTLDLMGLISEWYDSEEARNKYDNGQERGMFHFISVAFKAFINKKRGELNE